MEKILLYFSVKYHGDWDKIYEAIHNKETIDIVLLKKLEKKYEGKYISILDDKYPEGLRHISRAPFILYYEGNLDLLNTKKGIWPLSALPLKPEEIEDSYKKFKKNDLTIVNGYSSTYERQLVEHYKENMIIVKDGGIFNTLVITKELQEKFIKNNNLILTEYPGFTVPSRENWVNSNRIKIGLSNSLVLLSSIKEKNLWSIITNTANNGKEVYCLYDNNSKDNINNQLIENGAMGVTDLTEIKY